MSSSLYLSEKYSDVKLRIVGKLNDSTEAVEIPAHRAILASNSEYFELKFDLLISGHFSSEDAMIVDISELGTVSDVLDIFRIFYSNAADLTSMGPDSFKNLNGNILAKFLTKGIHFDTSSDIFKDITFKLESQTSYKGDVYECFITGIKEGGILIRIEIYAIDYTTGPIKLDMRGKQLFFNIAAWVYNNLYPRIVEFCTYHNINLKINQINFSNDDKTSKNKFKLFTDQIINNSDAGTKNVLENLLSTFPE